MHGLYLLWWVQVRHIPPALVAAILAAGDLVLTALEIPTGWLADRWGYRASLIAGSTLQIAGMLFCWLARGIPGLLSATVLVALGDAFRSGADQALLYRSCVALEDEADFQKIEAKTGAFQLTALVGLTLAGGVIVEAWGFAMGWLAETMLSVAGLIIAFGMVEPPARVETSSNSRATSQAIAATVSLSWRINELGKLIMLIVPASLLGSAASAALFLAQTAGGIERGPMTVFVAVVVSAEAAGAFLAARLSAGVRGQIILGSLGVVTLAAGLAVPWAFLPAVVGLSFVFGVAYPLRATAIQRATADEVRARAASIASACDKAFTTVALVSAGLLPRR